MLTLECGPVAEIVGVSTGTIRYWIRTGLIPHEQQRPGTGNARKFGFADILRMQTLKTLRDRGLSLQRVRRVLDAISERFGELDPLRVAQTRLVVIGNEVFWFDDANDEIINALTGQIAIKPIVVLHMDQLASEVHSKIEAMAA